MRLIDADALLDSVIERYCKGCDKRKGIKNGKYKTIYKIGEAPCRACDIDDLKGELEEAPTEMQWIPCSERLPEEGNTTYLTTVDYGEFGGGVGQRFFYGKNIGWEDDAVVAWMPLPEPYTEEEQ